MRGLRLLCSLAIVGLGYITNAVAQDTHLSQFDAAPLFFNPALAGNAPCEHRFVANSRRQWGNYETYVFAYDRKIYNDDLPIDIAGDLGLGALIEHSGGGSIDYATSKLRLIPAYHKNLLGSALQLSVGANFNLGQEAVDPQKIDLPDQTDESADLDKSSEFFYDLDLGVNLAAKIKQKYPVNLGMAFFNIVRSKESFTGSGKTEDKPRISFNANTIIPVAPMLEIWPSALFMNQQSYDGNSGGSNEFLGGTWVRYDISNQVKQLNALFVGAFPRLTERSNKISDRNIAMGMDALVVGISAEAPVGIGTLNAGISYDITVSELNDMTQSSSETGSFELSIKYFFCKKTFEYTPPAKLNPVFN